MDMNVAPASLLPDLQALLQQIEGISFGRKKTFESFEKVKEAATKAVPKSGRQAGTAQLISLSKAVSRLAIHAHDAMVHELDYFEVMIQLFAATTRSSAAWRSNFGFFMLDSYEGHEKRMQRAEPDCILEVARRICTLKYQVSPAGVMSALKIIANCCADNNANRKLIIHRSGIEVLLCLAQRGTNLDTLIPALYNVCVDYDEPAASLRMPAAGQDSHDDQADQAIPSLSIERLGAAYLSNEDFVTFELLLSFFPRVSDQTRPYLAELIEMATEPALSGVQHIYAAASEDDSWTWSFTMGSKTHDTVRSFTEFSDQSPSCLGHLSRAMANILSQKVAQDSLLSREDDSIWKLLTMACPTSNHDELEELQEELHVIRRVFLKVLYQLTGDPSFCLNQNRASSLIRTCTRQLESRASFRKGQGVPLSDALSDSQIILTASACVIVSQLLASPETREDMVDDTEFCMLLSDLIGSEEDPEILYPAVTIVSRMALALRPDLPFGSAGTLRKMQRLLTAKGLGLIVPFETVTALKAVVRGRPDMVGFFFSPDASGRTISDDTLQLWTSTVEAGTKIEVAKFFLEILRTVLPSMSADGTKTSQKDTQLLTEFSSFVTQSSTQIAEVFAWICTDAEPTAQRDHGWFGLAMLSVWLDGGHGIIAVLEQSEILRSAVTQVSQLKDGAGPNNLKLMLSKLYDSTGQVPPNIRNILSTAALNLGLPMDF